MLRKENKQSVQHSIHQIFGKNLTRLLALSLFSLNTLADISSNELPQGADVVSGDITINSNDNVMNIDQDSQQGIIDWQTFNVGSDATVNFNQPNSSASTLNRVVTDNSSQIYGNINANGQVLLVNSSGVYISENGRIETGGIVATTQEINNQEYLDNPDRIILRETDQSGSIENHGTVIANEAYVAMLAPEVRNEGLITANMGEVVLASGREIILSFNDGQITDVITTPSLLNSLIENKLAIEAAGGKVILSATAMNQINGGLINQAGSINVGSTETVAVNEGGRIFLTSNEVVFDGGSQTLANADTQGGEIEVAANDISIEEDARIEASAILNGDGGSIELVAQNDITINGVIKADGADEGVGGEVLTQGEQVILEDNAQISAKSGENAPIIQENNIKILENDEIVAQNSYQGNWRIVSAASVWTQTHASVIELALLNANVSETVNADLCVTNCFNDQVGDLVIGDDITLNNRSTTLTQLELTASDYLSLQGTLSDEYQNLILEATGFNGLSVGTVADITANQVSFRSGEQLDVLGSVITTGNENTNPLANFIGANMVMAGLIQTSNQTRLGRIVMTALNQINLRPESKVLANGDFGGTVLVNARHLDVDGFIQSNGGTGRGGTITLDIEETVDMNQAWIESNGFDAGGTIKIQVRDGPLNMDATRIQTNASNGRGGTILISGREHTRIISSHIESKGTSQGGEIYLGYDQDNQRIPFSKYLYISKNTIVDARNFNNTNGGFVETSGHVVNILATINVGRGGMWLIDPFDVTISNTASGDTYSANFDPTQTTVLNASSIEGSLNSGTDVSITTGSATANTLTVDFSIQPKSFSGATLTLTGGTIDINRDITGDGVDLNLVLNGATIDIDNSISLSGGNLTINASSSGDISSSYSITAQNIIKGGSGDFTVNSSSTISGDVTINAGAIIMATATPFGDQDININSGGTLNFNNINYDGKGSINLNGGTLSASGGPSTLPNDSAINLLANSTIDVASSTELTLSGVISGGYAITKTGAGTLTLSANNTFTHGLNVNAGTVSVSATQFGLVNNTNFDLVISNGGTFIASGNDIFANNQTQIISTVEIQSGGTMTNGGNFFSRIGNLTLSGGTLTSTGGITSNDLSDSVAWTLSDVVTATADSSIGGTAEIFNGHGGNGVNFSVSDGATLTVSAPLIDGDDSTWSGTGIATGFSKTGLGTLLLSGTNTFNGTVTISAGTLAISNASALGTTSGKTTVSDGATLQISGGITVAENMYVNGSGVSSNGAIYFLSGNNTYSGAIVLQSNSTMTSAAGNQTFSGTINGAYDLTITAAGNWSQSAAIGGISALADYSLTASSGNVSTNSITASGSINIFGIDVSQTYGSSITAGSNEDIIISATGDYTIAYSSGSNALVTSGTGRWIVYAADDDNSNFGDSSNGYLNSNNTAIWGYTYSTLGPESVSSGNRYVLAETNNQTITFTTSDETITYGDSLDLSDNYTLTTSGLSGLRNVYDAVSSGSITLATVYSSNPTISIVATGATTSSSGNTEVGSYTTTLSLSGGSTNTGYSIASPNNSGTLTVNAKALTYTLDASNKTYDGTDAATVTITLTGLVGAETLTTTETSTFAQSTVGTGITVTVDSISLVDGTGDADNYTITSGQTDTADITAKALTATADAADKTYDGTATATVTLTLSGVVGSDSVSSTNGATFSQSNVGTGLTATINSITLTGDDADNYTISSGQTDTADITAKALTATADAADKTYDGTATATVTLTLSGVVGSDSVSSTNGATFSQSNVGTGLTATINSITLTGDDADNYTISSGQTDTADITAKALTISGVTASDKTYDGDNTATIDDSSAVFTGLVVGDTVTVTATGTFSDANVGTGKTVTLSETTGGADEGNYSITTQGTTTANITAKALTYTLDASNKTYDGTDAATVTITLTGLVGAETLTTTETSTFAQSTVGTGITVTVDSISLVDGTGDADNYTITSGQTDTADITAKALTATADAADKTYDGTATATVTLTLSGVVGSDSVSSTNGATFSQSNVGTGLTATINSITLTGDDADNYTISSGQTDTADITQKALGYTVDASNKTYDGTDAATVTITLTGLVGAETLTATGIATFDSANVGTRTATVNTITLTDGTGDADNYSISTGGTDSASITQKALTYTVDANDKTYDGTRSATATLSLSGLVGSETLDVSNTATFANTNAGDDKTVTVTSVNLADGTNGGLAANYSISSGETTTATINKATLNVAPLDDAKFVGEADPAGYNGVIYNGFISGESSSDLGGSTVISRNAGETVGDYALSLTQALTSDNYTINYGTGTFTIAATTAILVDLVQNNTLYYGSDPTYGSGQSHTISARDIDGALTVTMSGQEATLTKSGTTVAVAPLVPDAATSSTAGYYEVGGYNYSVDTADANYSLADGYSIVVDSGEYNITPLEIDVNATVTVGGLTKTYDGNANISGLTTTISSSPVKTGDDVTFAATGTFDSRHVGTSKTVSISMAISGDDANNYSLSNNSISSNTGTITQLNSVTWLGSAGDGLWATASNWANGAIPDQSNVATVIIPDGSTVNYQYDVLGQVGSAITNNGDLTLSGTTDFTFSNDVAGDGTIIFDADQVGDTLTLSGTSTMSGTVNIQEHTAIIAASNALGTATLRANDGYFSVSSGVTLNQLTTAGQINLTSDLNTNGDIIFGGNLVIAGGNGTDANNLDPLEINSNNNDITFNGTVTAGSASKANFRSLTIDAGTGEVNINDRFGYAFNGMTYSNLTSTNLWQLNVTAAAINLRADVMTFERQTYNGAMFVGDNGTNGLTRTLLSVDPEVIINGTVDDLDPNTSHTLVTKAVSLNTDTPVVNITGEVGATNPLVNWIAETGRQNTAEEWGNITTGTSGTLTYQGDAISGGAQTIAASEQSGYLAPTNTTTDSTAQNAGSIAGRFKQAYRNIVSNTTEKFREIRQKTMIGIGVKILDDKRDCDASGANDCKSTITIRGMLDQLIRKLWIRFA